MDGTLPKVVLQVLRKWHVLRRKGGMDQWIGRQGHNPRFIWKEEMLHCDGTGINVCHEGRAGAGFEGSAASGCGLPAGWDGGVGASLLVGT